MPEKADRPVQRIYIISRKDDGLNMARLLYTICRKRHRVPAFFVSEQFDETLQQQFNDPLVPSVLITFGPGSEAVYETWQERHPLLKVLQVLDQTAPRPKPFISDQMQILPWPEKIRDFEYILNWVGLVDDGFTPEMDVSGNFEGAIPEDKLQEYPRGVFIFSSDSRRSNDNFLVSQHCDDPPAGYRDPNPPVLRVYLVGPKEEGLKLARAIYAICKERLQVPSFHLSQSLTKKLIRDLYRTVCRTALITFGPKSKEIYERMLREHDWVKVMRILDLGASEPKLEFNYDCQIFPYPDAELLSHLVSWLGIDRRPGVEGFTETLTGALSIEELEAAE